MIRKCEEVARLTDDLFLHSLSDLDKLKIHPERVELAGLLEQALEELSTEQEIFFGKPDFACYACVDRNRMIQVIENLVANARKYAKTPCMVTLEKESGVVQIRFRDYGKGIPDEDLPFIFNKFYRGRNCGSEPGSGLGLSIVRYIMEQHKGRVALRNLPDGLEVTLTLSEAVS
ncbi:Adaptive-response sensory-kinase SasA [compost metagenome]